MIALCAMLSFGSIQAIDWVKRLNWARSVALILLFISLSRISSIYLSALWFGSLGYSSVYWYIFKAKLLLFVGRIEPLKGAKQPLPPIIQNRVG